ncbi:Chlorophyll A-B binding protein [Gracilaria domingensis]|nr:Chlorophyll A-B binding protein [Gracilaria domingensis]
MVAFITPVVTGFSSALRGQAVCHAPAVSRSAVSMKISPAMPFMEQPPTLDDDTIIGNVGFDPLNLSKVFNLKFMQEAEIKHCTSMHHILHHICLTVRRANFSCSLVSYFVAVGRVAMLGVLGYIIPEVFQFPWGKPLNPVEAHEFFVKTGGMSQLLLFLGFLEIFGAIALKETLEGDRAPGYFGFDPLGLGKDPEKFKKYHLSEIKNGRLAMCAFGGLYHATLLTKQGTLEQLTHFQALPGHLY